MIGRKQERNKLDELLKSSNSELLAVIGRRRVGKTYLIRQHYKKHLVFDFTGTQNAEMQNQLKKFANKLNENFNNKRRIRTPQDWAEAFELLKTCLLKRRSKKKYVLFFDELPWLAGRKSGFLQEFGYWWNDWGSKQNIVVVICGSAASWMIEKIVNNRGGLHNRITDVINLKPFTLSETKEFLKSKSISLDHYQIIQIYMTLGGVPHYLQHIKKGESATQIINRLLLQKNGLIRNEFDNLYQALYEKAERHVAIIEALGEKWQGLTRNEIAEITGLHKGGGLTNVLKELLAASFVKEIVPFGKKKKDSLYRLVDEYSLFYMHFINGKKAGRKNVLSVQDHSYRIWQGYAFENICIKHIEAIKKSLGISGINTRISSYRHAGNMDYQGLQIDLLIDRNDKCINLCEMKFYDDTYVLDKKYADKLRKRRASFRKLSNTRKTIFTTMITTYGVAENQYKIGELDHDISMDDLFVLDSFKDDSF